MHKESYPGISDSVVGMVFLGTPHGGIDGNSALRTQGQIYNAVLKANIKIEDNILHSIAKDNDVLYDAVQNFTKLVSRLEENKPKLFCFYEEKACKPGLGIGLADEIPSVSSTMTYSCFGSLLTLILGVPCRPNIRHPTWV